MEQIEQTEQPPTYSPRGTSPISEIQFDSPEPPPEQTPGRIKWLASQIRAIHSDSTEAVRVFDEEIARLKTERDRIARTADDAITYLETELLGYHRAMVADGGRKRVELPAGRLQATKAQMLVRVADADDLIQFASDQGLDELLTIRPSVAGAKAWAKQIAAKVDANPGLFGFDRLRSAAPLVVTAEMMEAKGIQAPSWLAVELRPDAVKFTPAETPK